MNFQIRYTREAKADLQAVVRYYSDVAPHILSKLQEEIRYTEEHLRSLPSSCQTFSEEIRRAFLHSFPYTFFYRVKQQTVEVAAILPQRVGPNTIHTRLFH